MTVLQIPTARVVQPLLGTARYKGAYGGRGGLKSHFFAGMAVERALMDASFRFVGIRETQKSLEHSVKQLLADKIQDMNAGYYFRVMDKEIVINGDRGGHMIFQGMQQHTADSIKSLEGYDVAWGEEAHALSHTSLRMLRPTIRKPGSELWFSWNPRRRTDAVDQLLRGSHPPKSSIVIPTNWRDNPWFPEELRADMEEDRLRDPDTFGHVWEGDYLSDHAYQLIAMQWVVDASTRKYTPDGSRPRLRISVDVADGGPDSTVVTARLEYATFDLYLRQESHRFPQARAPIMAADAAEEMFNRFGGTVENGDDIVVDAMGVGSGTAGTLITRELPVICYAGGSSSDNNKKWRNRRVQSYLVMRNKFRDGRIAFAEDFVDDQREWQEFEEQVCMVRRRPGAERVEDLETKEQLTTREGVSPDRADSMAMQYATQAPSLSVDSPGTSSNNFESFEGVVAQHNDGGIHY